MRSEKQAKLDKILGELRELCPEADLSEIKLPEEAPVWARPGVLVEYDDDGLPLVVADVRRDRLATGDYLEAFLPISDFKPWVPKSFPAGTEVVRITDGRKGFVLDGGLGCHRVDFGDLIGWSATHLLLKAE